LHAWQRCLLLAIGTTTNTDGPDDFSGVITSETPELKKLCHNQPLEKCSFSKDRVIKEGITLYGDYSQGVLTLDEDWS
jgi:hypothetical protein